MKHLKLNKKSAEHLGTHWNGRCGDKKAVLNFYVQDGIYFIESRGGALGGSPSNHVPGCYEFIVHPKELSEYRWAGIDWQSPDRSDGIVQFCPLEYSRDKPSPKVRITTCEKTAYLVPENGGGYIVKSTASEQLQLASSGDEPVSVCVMDVRDYISICPQHTASMLKEVAEFWGYEVI